MTLLPQDGLKASDLGFGKAGTKARRCSLRLK